MELQQQIENKFKELDKLGADYAFFYKATEIKLRKLIEERTKNKKPKDLSIEVKLRCLQSNRLDFDINFYYNDEKSFGNSINCMYRSDDFTIVNKKEEDLQLYLSYSCGKISKNDVVDLFSLSTLVALVEDIVNVEKVLWQFINDEKFVELDRQHNIKTKELQDLKVLAKELEEQETKNKIQCGACFKHKDLPYHIYKIVKVTPKCVYYDDYLILNETKTQLVSETTKMKISDFIRCIKWEDYYFVEDK